MEPMKPLVSVVVLTYNSSEFIKNTLDSVLEQDYSRIELIVSDDGSKDDTCKIVEKWLDDNSKHFERSSLIKSFQNRGTCKNYNQGVFNSHGEYIKTLDGDDLLNGKDAISEYTQFLMENHYDICISDVKVFSDEDFDLTSYNDLYNQYIECVKEPLPDKKVRILRGLYLADPGLFFSRKLYEEVGGFDEKYKLLEEWPFFLYVLDANYNVEALNKKLVAYRITASSATHAKTRKSPTRKLLIKDDLDFLFDVRFKRLLKAKEPILAFRQLGRYLKDYLMQII